MKTKQGLCKNDQALKSPPKIKNYLLFLILYLCKPDQISMQKTRHLTNQNLKILFCYIEKRKVIWLDLTCMGQFENFLCSW